jgi:hypothetical protein
MYGTCIKIIHIRISHFKQCKQYRGTQSLNELNFEVTFLILGSAVTEGDLSIHRLTSVVASLPWKLLVITVLPPLNCFLQVTHLQLDTLTVAKSQNLFQ